MSAVPALLQIRNPIWYVVMKIEKINDNQIKCTLTRSDLASRQLKLSELAYGTEKAKGLFQDMMEQANLEFGFDVSDIPLMIEAIPVSMDCIILMITKVEDPDEVDTKLSSFLNLKELFSTAGSEEDSEGAGRDSLLTGGLSQFQELAEKLHQNTQTSLERLYSFKDLETVITLSHHIQPWFSGDSILYKSAEDDRYYLYLSSRQGNEHDFVRVCDAASEFGTKEPMNAARAAFMNEHFEKLLDENAVQSLAYV